MYKFVDNDAAYIEWVKNHPYGFVVVSWNPPRQEYISLHRADCHCINPEKAPHVSNWTKAYIKACANTINELENWAEATFGTGNRALRPCGHCKRAGRV